MINIDASKVNISDNRISVTVNINSSFPTEDKQSRYQKMITANLDKIQVAVGYTTSVSSNTNFVSQGTYNASGNSAQSLAFLGAAAILSSFAF